jgi:uncharacterized membrane protein YvbJ
MKRGKAMEETKFVKNGKCTECGSPVDRHQSHSGETVFYCSNEKCEHSKEDQERVKGELATWGCGIIAVIVVIIVIYQCIWG